MCFESQKKSGGVYSFIHSFFKEKKNDYDQFRSIRPNNDDSGGHGRLTFSVFFVVVVVVVSGGGGGCFFFFSWHINIHKRKRKIEMPVPLSHDPYIYSAKIYRYIPFTNRLCIQKIKKKYKTITAKFIQQDMNWVNTHRERDREKKSQKIVASKSKELYYYYY